VIGSFESGIAERYHQLLSDPRVATHGILDRIALAEHMSRADVFVFPSLAEGSARVIPMAMSCGCFVITTPNSGSVVEHARHGFLIPPGDRDALRGAIAEAASDRDHLRTIGDENRRFVLQHLAPGRYGDDLDALYRQLLDRNPRCGA
jgi:glycosyltransferase involved in cell wall biosynthesis